MLNIPSIYKCTFKNDVMYNFFMDVKYGTCDRHLGCINPVFEKQKVGTKEGEKERENKQKQKRGRKNKERGGKKKKNNSIFQILGSKYSQVRVIFFFHTLFPFLLWQA